MSHERSDQPIRSGTRSVSGLTLQRILILLSAIAVTALLVASAVSHTIGQCDARGTTTMSVWGVTIFPEGQILSGDETRWWAPLRAPSWQRSAARLSNSARWAVPNDGVQRSRATSFGRSDSFASFEVSGCSMFFVLFRSAR
jgi:hypothetical protein